MSIIISMIIRDLALDKILGLVHNLNVVIYSKKYILKEENYIMTGILSVSVALLAGLLMTRLFKIFKLPAVTSYLVAGVLIGPYCIGAFNIHNFGFHNAAEVNGLSMLSEVALGFIAFSIGSEFRKEELKKTGKQAFVIGILQALTATLLVDLALVGLSFLMPGKITVPQIITLGAIATATAPAATLMVVKQYKANGPLTKLLLPIVALDDAVGLIVFAVSFGIAKTLISGAVDIASIIINPLIEIACSLALGAIMGYVLTYLEKMFNSNTNRLNLTIAIVLLTVALTTIKIEIGPVHIGFSSLLTCMMLGTIFCNICPLSENLMGAADKWTSPLFAVFFVVSGAALEMNVFTDAAIIAIGVVYILFRSLGKYLGTFASAKMTSCSNSICKYLGITLLPQAGVALGMCTTAMQLGEQGNLIRNITLFAVLIYELVGPLLTKMALTAAGEITPMSEEVKNRRQTMLEGKKVKQ